jgi:hypothetical protein
MRALRALWFKLDEDDQVKKQVYYLLAERKGTSLEVEEAGSYSRWLRPTRRRMDCGASSRGRPGDGPDYE